MLGGLNGHLRKAESNIKADEEKVRIGLCRSRRSRVGRTRWSRGSGRRHLSCKYKN